MVHKPKWFNKDKVLIINAPTCGINKDGQEQYVVDPGTGARGSNIDDKLAEYTELVAQNKVKSGHGHIAYKSAVEIQRSGIYVPCYFDDKYEDDFVKKFSKRSEFFLMSLGELNAKKMISIEGGHGSPSADQRTGEVPYIKVSDLRAGSVNINPTNMIPKTLAETFWGGSHSGLAPYDLLSPERASKNIGEFCVLLPGQEEVVLTKEVIVIRADKDAVFDQFYLMWALSLTEVRNQWKRIIFMQTNREDVGDRMMEIKIPVPKVTKTARDVAKPFKDYYLGLERLREVFRDELDASGFSHHIFHS